MKILFLFTLNKSFLSDYYKALAKHSAERGLESVVFSFKKNHSEEVQEGVTYITAPNGSISYRYKRLFHLIRSQRPQIIISNFSYVNPALLIGRMLRIPTNIAWQHTLIEQTKASKKQILIKRLFLKMADAIIVNSTYLKEELENEFGVAPKKIKMLAFWSTIQEYQPMRFPLPNATFTIGCCGRIETDKNQRTLLEAFALLKSRIPHKNVKLVFAGDGGDINYIKQRIQELQLAGDVLFLGLLSAQEMVYFYNQMDLLVLPSLHEAFGLTFIEAIALNRPVFVSNRFGALTFIAPELLEQHNITFNPSDSNKLALKLENYISENNNTPPDNDRLYNNGFSENQIKEQFMDLIKTLDSHN